MLPDPRPPGGEVELLGSAPPSGAVELLGPGPPDEEDELLGPVPPDAKVGLLGALDDRSGMDGSATSMTSEADPPPWDSMKSICLCYCFCAARFPSFAAGSLAPWW